MQTLEFETKEDSRCQEMPWYAVHTRYQHEQQVNQQLKQKGFPTFYPTCKKLQSWSDRKKQISRALFPGYLFVSEIEDRRLQVVATPGVCGIVSIAGAPAPIPDAELEAVRRAISSPYGVQPHEFLRTGDPFRVVEGPLAGVTGILLRNDKAAKLVLSIELLGRSVAVEIDAQSVAKNIPDSFA